MPAKDFRTHLREAALQERYHHLRQITAGEYDDSIAFTFEAPKVGTTIDFHVVVSGEWIPNSDWSIHN